MTISEFNLSNHELRDQAKVYKIGDHQILLPLDHMLDQYQATWKRYDTVLGNVAQLVFQKYGTSTAIDIGANVGDSAALIRKYINVPVLCIEGNPQFIPFLEYNAAQIGDVQIAQCFIGKDSESVALEKIASQSGTASIVNAVGESSPNHQILLKSLATIIELYPKFQTAKLLKIDTDGYDFNIINNSVETINLLQPILCFEYDINFSSTGEIEGLEAIEALINIGYSYFLIYDNFGNYLISLTEQDYEKFIDLSTYLICNRRKSGNAAVFYFDIYAFSSGDRDLFVAVRDAEINS